MRISHKEVSISDPAAIREVLQSQMDKVRYDSDSLSARLMCSPGRLLQSIQYAGRKVYEHNVGDEL